MPMSILTSKYCGSSIWAKRWDSCYLYAPSLNLNNITIINRYIQCPKREADPSQGLQKPSPFQDHRLALNNPSGRPLAAISPRTSWL